MEQFVVINQEVFLDRGKRNLAVAMVQGELKVPYESAACLNIFFADEEARAKFKETLFLLCSSTKPLMEGKQTNAG